MPIQYTILIGFLSAVLTASATLCGVWLSNKGQKERLEIQIQNQQFLEEQKVMREKLEEMYLLFKKWCKRMEGFHMATLVGEVNNTEIKSQLNNIDIDPERLEMLVELYFPSMVSEYQAVLKARDIIAEALFIPKQETKKLYFQYQKEFDQSKSRFLQVMQKHKLTISNHIN